MPTTPQEGGPEGIASQMVDAPVLPDKEELAEFGSITRHERDQNFFIKQGVDFVVPLMKEEIAKAPQRWLQEHIHERVTERIFNDLALHNKKVFVEMQQDWFQARGTIGVLLFL